MSTRFKQEYREIALLGKGSYGSAMLLMRISDQRIFVGKRVDLEHMDDHSASLCVGEIQLLRKLDHPFIARLEHVHFLRSKEVFIMLKFYWGGDLDKEIEKQVASGEPFDEQTIMSYFCQVLVALEYVHGEGIVHRDIKPSNLFLTKQLTVCLGDFGVSKVLHNGEEGQLSGMGTPHYMAPEVFERSPSASYAVDMWSLGVVLYELATLKKPFDGTNLLALVRRVTNGNYEELPSEIPAKMAHIVHRLLQKDPTKRPSAMELLKESYVCKFKAMIDRYRNEMELISEHEELLEKKKLFEKYKFEPVAGSEASAGSEDSDFELNEISSGSSSSFEVSETECSFYTSEEEGVTSEEDDELGEMPSEQSNEWGRGARGKALFGMANSPLMLSAPVSTSEHLQVPSKSAERPPSKSRPRSSKRSAEEKEKKEQKLERKKEKKKAKKGEKALKSQEKGAKASASGDNGDSKIRSTSSGKSPIKEAKKPPPAEKKKEIKKEKEEPQLKEIVIPEPPTPVKVQVKKELIEPKEDKKEVKREPLLQEAFIVTKLDKK
eukprot:Platyproteum_vivax@DN4446_c0_g1_i1.p1